MLESNIWVVSKRPEYWAEIGWERVEENIWQTFDKLESSPEIQIDLETTGLTSFLTERVNSVQLGTTEIQYIYDVERPEDAAIIWPALKKFLHMRKDKTFLGQNLNFDIPYFYQKDIVLYQVYDTMLAEQVLNNGVLTLKNDLGSIVYRHLGIVMDKSRQKDISGGLREPEDVVYAGEDVLYLQGVKESQTQLAIKRRVTTAVELENQYLRTNAYLEFCGIGFQADRWMRKCRRDEYLEYGAWLALNAELANYLSPEEIAELQALDKEGEINWGSSSQVVEVFTRLGIDCTHPKEKRPSVDIKLFVTRKDEHPIIPLYIDYKEKNKTVTTYGRQYLDFPQEDKRIHTRYRQFVETGRTSCGNLKQGPFPNLQNQQGDAETHRCFVAQGANMLVIADYSSQESVLLADISGDKAMQEFFISGELDMHSYNAKQVWKAKLGNLSLEDIKEHHTDLRLLAKTGVFAASYGATGKTIAMNLGVSEEEGNDFYRRYFEAYPQLRHYYDEQTAFALKNGYIVLCKYTGRKRYLHGFREWKALDEDDNFWQQYRYNQSFREANKERARTHFKQRAFFTNLAMNGPIQGTAATMSKLAGIAIFEWILKIKKFGIVKIPLFVHDEWVIECNQRVAEKAAKQIESLMIEAGSKVLKNLDIKVSTKISKSWVK